MKLAIYGAGGLGREIAELAINNNRWDEVFFIDDTKENNTMVDVISTIQYSSFIQKFSTSKDAIEVLIGVGEPKYREKLYSKVKKDGFKFATLVSGFSSVSNNCIIGEGTIVSEFSTIHTNVKIGHNVMIQPHVTFGHDTIVGNHTVISSYFAPGGNLVIGNRVYIGNQSAVKESTRIGDDVIVGMGAVVYKDVDNGCVVVGNPARCTLGNAKHLVFN